MSERNIAHEATTRAAIWVGFAAFLFVFWQASNVFLIVFAGLVVAAIFSGIAGLFPWPRWVAHLVAYGFVFILLFGAMTWGGVQIVMQFSELLDLVEKQFESLSNQLRETGFLSSQNDVTFRKMFPDVGSAMRSANQAVVSVLGVFGNLFVVLFIAVFVSWNPQVYRRGLVSLMPKGSRDKVEEAVIEATKRLRQWLKGQGLAMLTVFAASWIILWLIDMPFAFALALQAGLLAFIQTIGPLLAGANIILVGLTVSPTMALWGLGAYVLIQLIESNLTTPLIQRSMTAIPPAISLSAQMLFGALFGILGLALAVPIVAVAMTLIEKLYVKSALGGGVEKSDED